MSKAFYVSLKNRGLIQIEGPDRYTFLQGLISNDIHKLPAQKILYSCLLTPQGKFLHDFFITEEHDILFLDCEGGARTLDLYNRLTKYRLRADVFISAQESHSVYAVFGHDSNAIADPRHFKMGGRSFKQPELDEMNFDEWDKERIMLTIPDGSRDMEIERSTLLESNIDTLNGIDWDKGCFIGQELTARMHYRHLGKKKLYTITGNTALPEAFSDIHLNGELIGSMRSSCGAFGLALLNNHAAERLNYEKNTIRLLG